MAGSLNIERVINTHTTVLRRKNSIIQHAPISDIRRLRCDMALVVLVFSAKTIPSLPHIYDREGVKVRQKPHISIFM